MTRGRWIWDSRSNKLVPAHEYERIRGERSELAAPMLMRDQIDPLWCPLDNQMHESKSSIRRVAKAMNAIEVGNEKQTDNRKYDAVTKNDVGQAIQKLNQGYKPNVQSEALE